MKKFVAELIGTFMLVFIGTGSVVFGHGVEGVGHLGIALAFGLSIKRRKRFQEKCLENCRSLHY